MADTTPTNDSTSIRARALCGAARLAWYELDLAQARAHLDEALALFRRAGDPAGMISAMSNLVIILTWQGESDRALSLLQEGMDILGRLEDRPSLLPVLSEFGFAAAQSAMPEALLDAMTVSQEVVRLARAAGDTRSLASGLANLGLIRYWADDLAPARSFYEESLTRFREAGDVWGASLALWGLSNVARRQGRYAEARTFNAESMVLQTQHKSPIGAPYTLESFAYIATAEEQPRRAARLLGAAQGIRERHGGSLQPLALAEWERHCDALCALLDPTEFESAWAEGRAWTTEEAIARALDAEDRDATPPAQAP
uniref:MalT-like TPR region domain-containing protein n=1 Tax=uncultured Armatimonadetes bacterium TaxID=157466 RepID=A0A6J4K377_9BACT|nr:hypothetical protein AVDCRST_MAG63-4900 [uncultured Armatimonadetes bacterium]